MGGFEELCCQLAALEDPAEGSRFVRKGTGADQGLECYRSYADGHEVGWQAKYFMNGFDTNQVADLAESLQRAMAAHPQLKTFIVCLPIDLQDNRSGKKLSQVQRYENWRGKSIKAAATQGRPLEIKLWSASSITERLGRDTPAYSGRARYWFDTVRFSSAWFREKFEVQRSNLGERYSPESHVDLPIQQALQALARDPELRKEPSAWAAEITYRLDGAARSLAREGLTSAVDEIKQACAPLFESLAGLPATLDAHIPLESLVTLSAAATQSVSSALTELQDKAADKDRAIARKDLFDLYTSVDHVRRELASTRWRLAACYGAMMQGVDRVGCKAVASAVWTNYFAGDRTPPLHLLARDYALWVFRCCRRPCKVKLRNHAAFDRDRHIAIHYPSSAKRAPEEAATALPHPKGMSGSLLWNTRFVEVTRAGLEWSPASANVCGVIWAALDSPEVVLATKIEFVRKGLTRVFA